MSKKLEDGPSDKQGQVDRRNLLKGAAAAGLGAMALGAAGAEAAARGAGGRVVGNSGLTVQHLVLKMVEDPEFARSVIADPQQYRKQYNLSRRAVESLRALRVEDFEHIQVNDARAFAMGAMTAATMVRHDFEPGAEIPGGVLVKDTTDPYQQPQQPTAGDTCYYFG
jgi:hypothetical protein